MAVACGHVGDGLLGVLKRPPIPAPRPPWDRRNHLPHGGSTPHVTDCDTVATAPLRDTEDTAFAKSRLPVPTCARRVRPQLSRVAAPWTSGLCQLCRCDPPRSRSPRLDSQAQSRCASPWQLLPGRENPLGQNHPHSPGRRGQRPKTRSTLRGCFCRVQGRAAVARGIDVTVVLLPWLSLLCPRRPAPRVTPQRGAWHRTLSPQGDTLSRRLHVVDVPRGGLGDAVPASRHVRTRPGASVPQTFPGGRAAFICPWGDRMDHGDSRRLRFNRFARCFQR